MSRQNIKAFFMVLAAGCAPVLMAAYFFKPALDSMNTRLEQQQATIDALRSDPGCAWAASAVDTLLRREQGVDPRPPRIYPVKNLKLEKKDGIKEIRTASPSKK